MRGSRMFGAAALVFAGGLAAAVYGVTRYDAAYQWVAHTSDVRMVIGRAVGHAGRALTCEGLERDLAELTVLTADNPRQQERLGRVRATMLQTCRGQGASTLVDELAELDATERELLVERREALSDQRTRTILAFVLSTIGAMAAVLVALWFQRRSAREVAASEEKFRMFAASSRDLIRIHEPDGKPTYVSPSVETLLGYTPTELLGEVPLALGHPDDRERMSAALTDIQKDGSPPTVLTYRLRTKAGEWRWFETHTNPIRDAQGRLLRFYTSGRDITDRVALEQKLEHEAITDELTGLLNRRGFLLLAGQEHRIAMRQDKGVALVFADLDGLKTINDKLGHDHGDRAIRELGRILRATFRESDVVARLGGDEFAALCYDLDEAKLDSVLARLRAGVAAAPSNGPYPLAVSLGCAILAPGTPRSLDELIAEADERMYANKRAKRSARE